MATEKLSVASLRRKKPGMIGDGGGLWLQIDIARDGKGRNRSWIFRYSVPDASKHSGYRAVDMGLGSLDTIGLHEAREIARQCRQQRLAGVDPLTAKRELRAARATAETKVSTFSACMTGYLHAHGAKWKSVKHSQQWTSSLIKYGKPLLPMPVHMIDTPQIVAVLKPIWPTKTETASRLRQRIEAVLSWGTVAGYRSGENPARWSGHLEHLLPSRRQIQPGEKLASMPYAELPGFMSALRERQNIPARALELLILCASRTGEVLGLRWDEIDGDVWTVPAARMKSGHEHVVPLCGRAVEIIEMMREMRQGEFVFPGSRGEALSPDVMARLIKRMGHAVTVHGLRATFKTWASERTNFQNEVIEASLAHAIGMGKDETERSYQRGTFFPKRVKLMQAWEQYCMKPAPVSATVTPIGAARA